MLVKAQLRKRSRLKTSLLKLLVFVVAIFSVFFYIVFYSKILDIQNVRILGAATYESEARSFLGENIVSSNILFWSPAGDKDASLKFSSIDVRKDFLERSIIATFTERNRDIIWCYEKTQSCFWADKDSLIFESAPKPTGNLIRSVTNISNDAPSIGDYAIDENVRKNFMGILDVVEKLQFAVSDIVIDEKNLREVKVAVTNGPTIVFGLDISPDFTEPAIKSFLKSDSWPRIKTINLTAYGRAYASF